MEPNKLGLLVPSMLRASAVSDSRAAANPSKVLAPAVRIRAMPLIAKPFQKYYIGLCADSNKKQFTFRRWVTLFVTRLGAQFVSNKGGNELLWSTKETPMKKFLCIATAIAMSLASGVYAASDKDKKDSKSKGDDNKSEVASDRAEKNSEKKEDKDDAQKEKKEDKDDAKKKKSK
jgi:hypothetical protein